MATQRIDFTGEWQALHTATVNDTSVIFTPRLSSMNWAIATSTPANDFFGHVAQANQDREVFLDSGESLYANGSVAQDLYVTITE